MATTRESPALYDLEPGVLSWSAFEACSTVAIAQATRRGEPLSLLVIRLSRGSATGASIDPGILARVIHRTVRSGDIVARRGQDSFAALLPAADEDAARGVADEIRAAWRGSEASDISRRALSQGIATLPESGTELDLLLEQAEQALTRAQINETCTIGSTGRTPVIDFVPAEGRGALSAEGRTPAAGSVLERLVQLYRERAEAEPHWLDPDLRSADAVAAARADPSSAPVPEAEFEVPSVWHDAALFGSDPHRRCRASDLAAYLDAFPPLPFEVDLDLAAGEAAYLLRSARYGWTAAAGALRGRAFPSQGSFASWIKRGGRAPLLPRGRSLDWRAGLLCLTSQRVIFGPRSGLEDLRFVAIREVHLLQGGLILVAPDERRLALLLPDATLVGLCIARALRDSRRVSMAAADAES
jgi:hypothetical protein